MRYLLPLFECEIETMMLKTKYYRKKDYFIIIIVYLVMSLPYIKCFTKKYLAEKHNIVTQTISVELFLNSLNNRTDKKSNIITIYENTIKKPTPMWLYTSLSLYSIFCFSKEYIL